MTWLPIETAPKDGTWILVYERMQIGHRDEDVSLVQWKDGEWRFHGGSDLSDELITHWTPFKRPAGRL